MIHKFAFLLLTMAFGWAAVTGCAQTTNRPEETVLVRPPVFQKYSQLGDPAPALPVKEWVAGRPVHLGTGTNIYVLVFCDLTRANGLAITNLNLLQEEYRNRGVVLAAISDNPPGELQEWVRSRVGEIGFSVAEDDVRRATLNYQWQFRQAKLPRAYIVGRDDRVLWYGHPLRDDLGQVVDDVVTGRFNLEQTKQRIESRDQLQGYLDLAHQEDPRMGAAGRILLSARTNDASGLCEMAYEIATDPGLGHRDVTVANLALDRAQQLGSTNVLDIALTRAILVFQSGQLEDGLARARSVLPIARTDGEKRAVSACIRAMEKRLAESKAGSTKATATTPPAGAPTPQP